MVKKISLSFLTVMLGLFLLALASANHYLNNWKWENIQVNNDEVVSVVSQTFESNLEDAKSMIQQFAFYYLTMGPMLLLMNLECFEYWIGFILRTLHSSMSTSQISTAHHLAHSLKAGFLTLMSSKNRENGSSLYLQRGTLATYQLLTSAIQVNESFLFRLLLKETDSWLVYSASILRYPN